MKLSRRKFLISTAVAAGAGLAAPGLLWRTAIAGSKEQFNQSLAIPPLADSRVENGKRIFDLQLQHGESHFFSDAVTPTFGINGNFLGPVIRATRGEQIRFNVTNLLSEPSTLHWHGVHLPARMDGGPHQFMDVGNVWSPEFTINQPASTQWYHSHMLHQTGRQVYQGLAGLFYIDDEPGSQLQLPAEYGVDDIPLVIQDRAFNRDGSFRYSNSMHSRMMGMMGNYIMVNGTLAPRLNVQSRKMRFRILNGSNARIYNLGFSDDREFMQIASDGGFLERPVALKRVQLAPGERAEIIVDFATDDDVQLMHKSPSGNTSRNFSILRLNASRAFDSTIEIPAQLAKVRNWSEQSAVTTRKIVLSSGGGMGRGRGMGMGMMGGFRINGKTMDMHRIDETVQLGDIEIWEFENTTRMPHPMHIHDIQFRILTRNGRPPAANEQGMKDTVLVNGGETVRVITQFEDYADPDSPYMFHCHNLEHEDAGMMGQFVVV